MLTVPYMYITGHLPELPTARERRDYWPMGEGRLLPDSSLSEELGPPGFTAVHLAAMCGQPTDASATCHAHSHSQTDTCPPP